MLQRLMDCNPTGPACLPAALFSVRRRLGVWHPPPMYLPRSLFSRGVRKGRGAPGVDRQDGEDDAECWLLVHGPLLSPHSPRPPQPGSLRPPQPDRFSHPFSLAAQHPSPRPPIISTSLLMMGGRPPIFFRRPLLRPHSIHFAFADLPAVIHPRTTKGFESASPSLKA